MLGGASPIRFAGNGRGLRFRSRLRRTTRHRSQILLQLVKSVWCGHQGNSFRRTKEPAIKADWRLAMPLDIPPDSVDRQSSWQVLYRIQTDGHFEFPATAYANRRMRRLALSLGFARGRPTNPARIPVSASAARY